MLTSKTIIRTYEHTKAGANDLFNFIFFLGFTSHSINKHHHYEIGLSNGIVYNITEKEITYGVHVHLMKKLGETDKFGIGYERIFDEYKHNTSSIILMYRPVENLFFNITPGVSWLETKKSSVKLAMHVKTLYEFELCHFHICHLVGLAFNTEDLYASVGLHLAYGF